MWVGSAEAGGMTPVGQKDGVYLDLQLDVTGLQVSQL